MKPIELFNVSDFDEVFFGQIIGKSQHDCAVTANAKLNDWLKSAVRVYGSANHNGAIFNWETFDGDDGENTHQALLVCVEELPKKYCEHEIRMHLGLSSDAQDFWADCKKCGIKLQPTGWKAVE